MKRSSFLKSLIGLASLPLIPKMLEAEKPVDIVVDKGPIVPHVHGVDHSAPFVDGQYVIQRVSGVPCVVLYRYGGYHIEGKKAFYRYIIRPVRREGDIGDGPGSSVGFDATEAHKQFYPAIYVAPPYTIPK
jgi:hypothetical protein